MSLSTNKNINGLILDEFMRWAGLHPLAFHDLELSTCLPEIRHLHQACANFHQFSWQGNGVSIEIISDKINEAYNNVEQLINFTLQPTFITEKIEMPKFFRSEYNFGYLTHDTTFKTTKNCVQDWGQPKFERLDTASTITYTDEDGDIFKETATIVFTVPNNLNFNNYYFESLYVTHSGKNGNKQFAIPCKLVSYDANAHTVTIVGNAWDFIKESIVLNSSFIRNRTTDGCDSNTYITTAELWYNYVDSAKPHGYVVCEKTCESCQQDRIPFCVREVNNADGKFKINLGSVDEDGNFVATTNAICCNNPLYLEINYLTSNGCVNNNQILGFNMCDVLKQALFKLTACLIPTKICGDCITLRDITDYYQTDLAMRTSGVGATASYNFSFATFENSFNRSGRGAVEAYKDIQEYTLQNCNKFKLVSEYL